MITGYKKEETGATNPLTKKWGTSDVRATAGLESTRKDMLHNVQASWGNLTEAQHKYWRDVLDFEQAWDRGTCTDWRTFWKQPRTKANQGYEVDLNGWWNKPISTDRETPTEVQEETPVPSPSAPVHKSVEDIRALVKSVFPEAKQVNMSTMYTPLKGRKEDKWQ